MFTIVCWQNEHYSYEKSSAHLATIWPPPLPARTRRFRLPRRLPPSPLRSSTAIFWPPPPPASAPPPPSAAARPKAVKAGNGTTVKRTPPLSLHLITQDQHLRHIAQCSISHGQMHKFDSSFCFLATVTWAVLFLCRNW